MTTINFMVIGLHVSDRWVNKKMRKFVDKHIIKAKNEYYAKYFEQHKSD